MPKILKAKRLFAIVRMGSGSIDRFIYRISFVQRWEDLFVDNLHESIALNKIGSDLDVGLDL